MAPRDPEEEHRTATPLELFLDLCFVVAVAASASVFHHDISAGHIAAGFAGFAIAFFAIWWAWVNYSWLASAYDSQDVRFRLLTFLVMVGVLVLAAGIPRGQGGHHDFRVMVTGYVIMRLAVVPMWFLVARDDPPRRTTALRYAWGIVIVQALWVARTIWLGHGTLGWIALVLLGVAELAIPWVAERSGESSTPWHRHHAAERYEAFTIIVLGEVLLATTQAISVALDSGGLTPQLTQLIVGALLTVFSLWWFYFKSPIVDFLRDETAFVFGYAHYLVFGSIAIVGAGLGAGVDVLSAGRRSDHTITLLIAAAIITFAGALTVIRRLTHGAESPLQSLLSIAALVLVALIPWPLGTSLLAIGLVLTASAVVYVGTHQPNN